MNCSCCGKGNGKHTVTREGKDLILCDSCYERLMSAAAFVEEGVICPECGYTYEEYEESGLLGCAGCYKAFRERLLPVIKKMQGKTEHTGKIPEQDSTVLELYEERERLRTELELALREKRMKDAERLNRDIRDISKAIDDRQFGGSDD